MPRMVVVLILQASVLAGCEFRMDIRGCEEQQAIADELATDPALGSVDYGSTRFAPYANTPCTENSGGSMVTAGRRYMLTTPLGVAGLLRLGREAADTGQWSALAEIRPKERGSGGTAHVCYQAVTGGVHRYLRLHTGSVASPSTSVSGPTFDVLYVEVSRSDDKVELCPT